MRRFDFNGFLAEWESYIRSVAVAYSKSTFSEAYSSTRSHGRAVTQVHHAACILPVLAAFVISIRPCDSLL